MSFVTVRDNNRWDLRVAGRNEQMRLLLNPELRAPKQTLPKRLRAAWLAVKAAFDIYQYAMEAQ